MLENDDDLRKVWCRGYSISELWGFTKPVTRGRSGEDQPHLIMWGILGIVEYQIDKGAGHKYLCERLSNREWVAVGYPEPKTTVSRLQIVPTNKAVKFGHKQSLVGDGETNYVDVRIVHARFFAEITVSVSLVGSVNTCLL